MLKFFLIIGLFFDSLYASDEVPNPRVWADEYQSNFKGHQGIDRYLVLEEKDGQWVRVDSPDFGLFKQLPQIYLDFYQQAFSGASIKRSLDWVTSAFKVFPLDRIIFSSENQISLYHIQNGKIESIMFRDQPALDWQNGAWLPTLLGYDGVVIDRRDSFLLVEAFLPLEEDVQGLVVGSSEESLRLLSKADKEGVALIQLIARNGNLGVFEAVVSYSDKGEVSPSSKVLLGRQ